MKIPEHDIIDVKWLIARATHAARPREEEARAAAEEILASLAELDGHNGVGLARKVDELTVDVPGAPKRTIRYAAGTFVIGRGNKEEPAPLAYDAGLRSFVGPEIQGALPGRNGSRPRVPALVALMRAALGEAAEVGGIVSRPISLRGG